MHNKNFVITSLQTWELGIGTTIRNFSLEISKQNKVLYINTPLDHTSWLRNKIQGRKDRRTLVISKKEPLLRKINENLWVLDFPFLIFSVNGIPFPSLFNFFNYLNNKKTAKAIRPILEQLGFKDYFLLIDTDIYRSFYLKELLKPSLSIYYRRDYIIGVSYWKKHGSRLEPLLAEKSDLVMANSSLFCDELKHYNPNTYLLETGVNLERYDAHKTYQVPNDVKTISHPIIGYIGSIYALRLDEPLLCKLAKKRPAYQFVFTGPIDEVFSNSPLQHMSNVHFTGAKTLTELPNYLSVFDVCINPQIVNSITLGNYPLKIDEYLAMGKPVVATDTPILKEVFGEHTHLAGNENEYLVMLDKAVQESTDPKLKAQRVLFAQGHSWENRTSILYEVLKTFSTK
ncbi:MAG: glycosyltransferase [Bacteroidales bacterium]|nr:glycosyltransferase [Bacteroidales bacterium]